MPPHPLDRTTNTLVNKDRSIIDPCFRRGDMIRAQYKGPYRHEKYTIFYKLAYTIGELSFYIIVIPAQGLVERLLAIYYLVIEHQVPRLESLGY